MIYKFSYSLVFIYLHCISCLICDSSLFMLLKMYILLCVHEVSVALHCDQTAILAVAVDRSEARNKANDPMSDAIYYLYLYVLCAP